MVQASNRQRRASTNGRPRSKGPVVVKKSVAAESKSTKTNGKSAPRAKRAPKIDDFDLQILNALRRDGRAPSAQIARDLGFPEGTVRYRINRLRAKGLIVSFSMPALDRVRPRVLVVFLIRTIPGKAMELVEQLKQNPNVRYLALAGSGFHDLFVSTGFANEDDLLDFRHNVMGSSGSVETFESVHLIKTIARSYDYTLPEGETGL
jgi:DNA-binding Lrp family transcriptional regulator